MAILTVFSGNTTVPFTYTEWTQSACAYCLSVPQTDYEFEIDCFVQADFTNTTGEIKTVYIETKFIETSAILTLPAALVNTDTKTRLAMLTDKILYITVYAITDDKLVRILDTITELQQIIHNLGISPERHLNL